MTVQVVLLCCIVVGIVNNSSLKTSASDSGLKNLTINDKTVVNGLSGQPMNGTVASSEPTGAVTLVLWLSTVSEFLCYILVIFYFSVLNIFQHFNFFVNLRYHHFS